MAADFAGKTAREAFGNFRCKSLADRGISSFKLDQYNKLPSGTQPVPLRPGRRPLLSRCLFGNGMVRSSAALPTPYLFVLYSNLHHLRD